MWSRWKRDHVSSEEGVHRKRPHFGAATGLLHRPAFSLMRKGRAQLVPQARRIDHRTEGSMAGRALVSTAAPL